MLLLLLETAGRSPSMAVHFVFNTFFYLSLLFFVVSYQSNLIMNVFLTLFLLVLSLFRVGFCDTQPEEQVTQEDMKKLPIKRLRQFLAARGLECRGCAEKDDYVKMAYENRDTPLAPIPEEPLPTPPSNDEIEASRARKKKDMEDLMAGFKGSGMGNMRMFSGRAFSVPQTHHLLLSSEAFPS